MEPDNDSMFSVEFNQENNTSEPMLLAEANQSLISQEDDVVEPPTETVAEQSEEIQQPLYKLNSIDTESSIKTEIKQLILSKISEEINSKALDDMQDEMEEQIVNLKTKTDVLQDKIVELDNEVLTDESRLAQSETILQRTFEMIGLLKETVDKLTLQCKESPLHQLLEKGLQQQEILKSLKNIYIPKIIQEKESLKKTEAEGAKRIANLKRELEQKEKVLKTMKQKCEEFNKVNMLYDEEIEYYVGKKQFLEEKLDTVRNKTIVIENEFKEEKKALKNLFPEDNQHSKLNEVNEEKRNIEQEINKILQEVEQAEAALTADDEKINAKEKDIEALKDSLQIFNQEHEEALQKLQNEYDDSCKKLDEIISNFKESSSKNDLLLANINEINNNYIKKCEEKAMLMETNLEKQNKIHRIQMDLLKKQMESDFEENRCEELQSQYNSSIELLRSLECDLTREEENKRSEITQMKIKFEQMQEEHDRYFVALQKKKEYLLANMKCFEEKSANLRNETEEMEMSVKSLNERNSIVNLLIESKLKQLEECNKKLTNLKSGEESDVTLKSGLRSPYSERLPKKVKFNEIVSFKSATSTSTEQSKADNTSNLETSLQEWLQEFDKKEVEEEEF